MPSYRILLEYDGTAFHGWQVQERVRTVQGEIERALRLLTRGPIRTAAAGRTDRGVHAHGQVVSFATEGPIDCRRVKAGIHGICGRELRARRIEEAPPGFHARHDARWRLYRYRLALEPSALTRERAWHPPIAVRLPLLRAAAAPLWGMHDFTAFANASDDNGHPVCMIDRAEWECTGDELHFTVRADRFLYKMVRTIVGTLVREAAPGREGAAAIARILADGDRRAAAPPAPAAGLSLMAVGYDPPWPGDRR
jgi:tRNA pseudouridine38-40 synthase